MAARPVSTKKRPGKKRGLLKIATLGVAGLIAGLLAGCTDSSLTLNSHHIAGSYGHGILAHR
jgi:hypothetical protein